ncbi:MAG: hypothetical protein Q4Q04_02275 [Methanocorpusculum sp.]|nr:hypothetical protein [Methanocorpusculum sp.]
MRKKNSCGILPWAGVMAAGVILLILAVTVFTDKNSLNGICFGLGAACFVLGLGNCVGKLVVKRAETPAVLRAKEIEEEDERNIRVRERAGWNTARVMNIILCLLALASALSNQEIYVTIILAALVVVQAGLTVGFQVYYDKRL